MPAIELFAFRFRDQVTGKWVGARYRATRDEIAARYSEWEIVGPAEVRGDDPVQMFNPDPQRMTRLEEPIPELSPVIDGAERFLLCLFLRRYVTWCARNRRFASMQGAAQLYREVCAQAAVSAWSR